MGFRKLNSSIKKLANTIEKQRKEKLKAKSAYDWLLTIQQEYIRQYNRPDEFTINDGKISMTRDAVNFSIIYQGENTRLMNPVTRKEIKSLLKKLEKDLDNQ